MAEFNYGRQLAPPNRLAPRRRWPHLGTRIPNFPHHNFHVSTIRVRKRQTLIKLQARYGGKGAANGNGKGQRKNVTFFLLGEWEEKLARLERKTCLARLQYVWRMFGRTLAPTRILERS